VWLVDRLTKRDPEHKLERLNMTFVFLVRQIQGGKVTGQTEAYDVTYVNDVLDLIESNV
jgi:hypothetical protein